MGVSGPDPAGRSSTRANSTVVSAIRRPSGVGARVSYVARDHNDEAGKDLIVGIVGGPLDDAQIEALSEHVKRWRPIGISSDDAFVHSERTNPANTKMGLARLVRAATNVAGAETDAPNFEAFLSELQQAVEPFEGMIALPPVGTAVQYYNPAYSPGDNQHTGNGPYAAIVTRAWEYADSRMCNLAVVTPGKDAMAEVRSVPERGSRADDGKYPSWEVIQ